MNHTVQTIQCHKWRAFGQIVAQQLKDFLHDLPVNALTARGYRSIGCQPCTRPTAKGENERAGRWSGFDKSECGIHTFLGSNI